MDTLRECADRVGAVERTGRGDIPAAGLSLDLAPWHGRIGLSLRLADDFPMAIFAMTAPTGCTSTLRPLVDRAHLIFLAGAEALLRPTVAEFLRELGIAAPVMTDPLAPHDFEYIIADPDATVVANYCDIVIANCVTQRSIGEFALD